MEQSLLQRREQKRMNSRCCLEKSSERLCSSGRLDLEEAKKHTAKSYWERPAGGACKQLTTAIS